MSKPLDENDDQADAFDPMNLDFDDDDDYDEESFCPSCGEPLDPHGNCTTPDCPESGITSDDEDDDA